MGLSLIHTRLIGVSAMNTGGIPIMPPMSIARALIACAIRVPMANGPWARW
jgi:hypothetical protein